MIGRRTAQIDGLVGRVEIPRDDNALPRSVERVADLEQGRIEVQLVLHAIVAALAAGEVDVEEQEAGVPGADDAPLHVEALQAEHLQAPAGEMPARRRSHGADPGDDHVIAVLAHGRCSRCGKPSHTGPFGAGPLRRGQGRGAVRRSLC